MGNFIFYQNRKVKAKGANPKNIIDEKRLKNYFLGNDYDKLSLLDHLPKLHSPSSIPLLFYPGCGVDIFTPLIYLSKLFPKISQAKLLFNDLDNTLGLIKTCLDEVGITFSGQKNQLQFYWQGFLIELIFVRGDMLTILNNSPPFDIYFERALRIYREKYPDYEQAVFTKIKPGGILISDSGYAHLPLHLLPAPASLSSYGQMIIGVKQ